jgi:hypothetical protein
MANEVTRLTNVIVPEVFLAYMVKDTMEKSAIFQSGAVVSDSMLGSKLAGGGETFQVPFWNDLANTEANIGSDDPSVEAETKRITASKMRARRQFRTQGWSDADLVKELAGSDPMARIVSRVGDYWTRQFQTTLISTLKGVFADNTANDSGDMTYDVSGEADPIDAMISADAILEAAQTMGDASDQLKVLIMHSRVYTTLAKQNLIDFIPNSEGNVRFPSYLGYYIVKDDGVQKDVSGGDVTYSTYLLGTGVVGFAESPPDVPVETWRAPQQGNGAGVEQLWTRRQYIMHPYGFDWTDSSVAAQFPTNAELATATNWNRAFPERKQIAVARLLTKNG